MGQSSYKDQYKPYSIKPAVQNPEDDNIFRKDPSPSAVYARPTVKFEGVSSYKAQYVEPPKVESKPIPNMTYQRAQVPFYGTSSYKNDFPIYKIESRVPVEDPTPNYRAPQVKFEGSTSYTDQYKGYQLKSPEQELAQSRTACIV